MINSPLKGKVNYEMDENGVAIDAGKGTLNNNTSKTKKQLKNGKVH